MTTEGEVTSTTPLVPPAARSSPEDAPLGDLASALTGLRDTVRDTRYALSLPTADAAQASTSAIVHQLDDYLLPRLARLDAPLLVVVGGSTGAGKSTLVNSLVRVPVSPSGVLRPTTRAPVLVCHPSDAQWFTEGHLLPGLTRTSAPSSDPASLQIVSALALSPGLAFLDAPDIDSIVDANRALANQLLAAADLWLFVTTASRYADAVPWDLLHTARSRGTSVALVLDRVPGGGAAEEITPHLTDMLAEHDLARVPLFVLPESRLDGQGLLGEGVVEPLRDWFQTLARDASARAEVVRQTVGGAIDALGPAVAGLAAAADDQVAAGSSLTQGVRAAYRTAVTSVERGISDGAILRGEVLARWQELVGTGDFMRTLQSRVGRWRDQVIAAFTGRPVTGERFQEALESGLAALVRAAATDAAEQAGTAWRAHPAGDALLREARGRQVDLTAPSPDIALRIERMVRDWERSVLELVRAEAGDKRMVARASAYAVNGAGLLVMVMVFTATAFVPTGIEIAVAGGTTVAAQKVLEAIFGDQAVRTLAGRAREDLLVKVTGLLDEEAGRYLDALEAAGIDPRAATRLRAAAEAVASARAGSALGSS